MNTKGKWVNSAARRRAHLKFRKHLCRILGCPLDSCYSTGELLRDARLLQKAGMSAATIRDGWIMTARHRKLIGDSDGTRDAIATARLANHKLIRDRFFARARLMRERKAEDLLRDIRRRDLMETREEYWS